MLYTIIMQDLQLNGYLDNTLEHNMYDMHVIVLIVEITSCSCGLPPFSRDAVRYSFGPVIQKQLSELVTEWNHHRIRKTSMSKKLQGGCLRFCITYHPKV